MIYFTDSVFDTVKNIGENAIAGDIHNVQDVLKRQVGLFLHCKVSKNNFFSVANFYIFQCQIAISRKI